MATKSRAVDIGSRLGYRFLAEAGRSLRDARVGAGLSQAELGRSVGASRTAVARCESGRYPPATVIQLARMLRVLGLELRFSAFPVASPLRDAGHLKVVQRVLDEVREPLAHRTDAPFPNAGDMRAWDILLLRDRQRVAIEVETRLHDLQELVRRMHTKRRDGMVDGLVLVLAASRHNRHLLPALESLLPQYPVMQRAQFVRTLNAGLLPPDGIVLL
jgi:DNA-binding XRE family transcriptional regulator